jgi:hypothetical protein
MARRWQNKNAVSFEFNSYGLVDALNRKLDRIKKAERRALAKTAAWARLQTGRALAKEIGIPVGSAKKSTKWWIRSKDPVAYVRIKSEYRAEWLATPAKLAALKRRKKSYGTKNHLPSGGLVIGKFAFAGAFVARNWNRQKGGNSVWHRTSKARHPLAIERFSIQAQAVSAFDQVKPSIAAELNKKMSQELNYALNVEK